MRRLGLARFSPGWIRLDSDMAATAHLVEVYPDKEWFGGLGAMQCGTMGWDTFWLAA